MKNILLIIAIIIGMTTWIGCGNLDHPTAEKNQSNVAPAAPSNQEVFRSAVNQNGVHRVDFHVNGYTSISNTEARFVEHYLDNGNIRIREWNCVFKTAEELEGLSLTYNQHIEVLGKLDKVTSVTTDGNITYHYRIYLKDCEINSISNHESDGGV